MVLPCEKVDQPNVVKLRKRRQGFLQSQSSVSLGSPCHEISKRVVLGLKDCNWPLGSVQSIEQEQNGAEADDWTEDQRVPPLPQVDPLDQIVDGREPIWEGGG